MTSEPPDPPVLYDEISRSVNFHFRNSCCVLPALRQVKTALLMCSPVAQARNSFGEDLLIGTEKWKSCMLTLPEPPPRFPEKEPVFCSPHEKDMSSISFSWPFCRLSPSMPSIFKK